MKAGWEVKPLGEVCEKITDGTHHSPKKTSAVRNVGQFPYVTSKNIRNGVLDRKNITYVDAEFHEGVYSRCPPEFGDVLLTKDGSNTGQVTLNTFDEPISLLSSVCLIKPKRDQLLAQYVAYYLQSDEGFENLTGQMTGAAIKRIILKNIKTSSIPVPPLEEQKRIVAVLDAAFERLTRAKENAEANLQNARELFENHLSEVFHTSDDGHASKLGEGVEILTGFAFKSAEYSESADDMPMVRGDNIVQGKFRWKNVKRWPMDKCDEFEKFRLAANDVLLAMDRTWVKDGIKYAIVSEADLPLLLVQRVARLRCLAILDSGYLGHFIGSKQFEKYVLSIQTGMGVPHISGQQIKDCPFNIPDVLSQRSIVVELNAMRSKMESLEADYRTKLTDIADLRQSLLQKAFAGELT